MRIIKVMPARIHEKYESAYAGKYCQTTQFLSHFAHKILHFLDKRGVED